MSNCPNGCGPMQLMNQREYPTRNILGGPRKESVPIPEFPWTVEFTGTDEKGRPARFQTGSPQPYWCPKCCLVQFYAAPFQVWPDTDAKAKGATIG